ncbi:MAG: MFS transporter [Actinobacteria bacterium]|nr:MFS transporter [Actinomycetota bacterium]
MRSRSVGDDLTEGTGNQLVQLVDLMRRNRDFRLLFLGSIVSFLGDWFALVAVAGLVKELTGSEGATAWVFAAEVLPIFFLSPFAGVLADRLDRKKLMILSALLRVVPALGLVAASQLGQAWLAYVCVASISALAAFYEPIASAVLPNVVDEEDLSLAMTVFGSVWGTMLFVGAALGGAAAAAFGREASFLLNAGTFVVTAGLLWTIRRPFNAGRVAAPASVLTHLTEVWDFVRPRKVTRAFLVTKTGVGVGNGVVGLLPVFAVDRFAAGDAGIGILLAARGLGALIGPYIGRRLHRDDGRRLVFWCGASIVAYAIAYLFLPFVTGLWVAAGLIVFAHAGGGNQWISSTYGLQLTTPDAVRGRIMSLDFGLATLAMGLSAILAGVIAEFAGLDVAVWTLAAFAFVYGSGWLAWTRDLWGADEDPVVRAPRGDVAAAVEP